MKVIVTGATGMVGEGVVLECLSNALVSEVLIVNRKPAGIQHPKLKELLVPDFFKLEEFGSQLKGYDACFYCAGVSSAGMKEDKYTYITYDTTLAFATQLLQWIPDIVFTFVTGSHTDSSENGRVMWARVKGKTENALMKLPFRGEYNFRPGVMSYFPGQKNTKPFYGLIVKVMGWFVPEQVLSLEEVGKAMINTVVKGYSKQILEIRDIKELSKN